MNYEVKYIERNCSNAGATYQGNPAKTGVIIVQRLETLVLSDI